MTVLPSSFYLVRRRTPAADVKGKTPYQAIMVASKPGQSVYQRPRHGPLLIIGGDENKKRQGSTEREARERTPYRDRSLAVAS